MTRLALKDELLDGQLLRAVGSAPYGGADIGECLTAAGRVRGTDLDQLVRGLGVRRRAGRATSRSPHSSRARRETARLAYLRACTYDRTAGVMLLGAPLDDRLVESNPRQTEAFRAAGALMDVAARVARDPLRGHDAPRLVHARG